jgi:hypothetical protein
MRLAGVVLLAVASALVPLVSQAHWETAQDCKSISQLEALTLDELFNEALDVCVQRALVQGPLDESGEPTNAPPPGASAYLNSIADVVATKSGGTAPAWMKQLLAAPSTKLCQEGFRTYLAGDERPKKRATPKARRERRRERRHERRLDLPPWFAPP